MTNYEVLKKEMLKKPSIKAEYDALEPEFDITRSLIEARKSLKLTQKELSDRTGITQADISRIENGTRNPSLAMLKRLAKGMGMKLRLEFVPEGK
ncbi:MAG: helix-turn-helix transcriptional regulator [Veillonellaceae bacterium]|nr:helix-turn-helix transcriptional regulator [Veillonellaceae bacterium]